METYVTFQPGGIGRWLHARTEPYLVIGLIADYLAASSGDRPTMDGFTGWADINAGGDTRFTTISGRPDALDDPQAPVCLIEVEAYTASPVTVKHRTRRYGPDWQRHDAMSDVAEMHHYAARGFETAADWAKRYPSPTQDATRLDKEAQRHRVAAKALTPDRGELEIRHTRTDGTLVDGTSKGDGSNKALKAAGFRWFPSLGIWGLRHSRDKEAQHHKIDHAANGLREAGFTVTVHIDEDTRRSTAEAEAEAYERAETRADHFTDRAARAASASDEHWEAGKRIAQGYNGQPILVGHHSERRHRRDIDRAENHYRRAIDNDGKATYYSRRADASASHQEHRESVPVTLRRIEKLEAEQRKWQRERANAPTESSWRARCDREIRDLDDKIAYWKNHIEQATAADPTIKVWGRGDFAVGDFAQIGSRWHQVLRVNAKSLTVASRYGGLSPVLRNTGERYDQGRVPYHEVNGHATAEEIDTKFPPET